MSSRAEMIAEQLLNANINKKTWGDLVYNVMAYGAKGDGVADDTTAIRAAIDSLGVKGGIVYFPPGVYKTTGIINITKVGTQLIGAGRYATVITNSASTVFNIEDGMHGLNFEGMEIQCGKAGGAIFSAAGMISLSRIYDCKLWSADNASYIWYQFGGTMGYIDNLVEHCDLVCSTNATVSPWFQVGGNGAINSNSWKRIRVTAGAGPVPFFHIEETGAGQYAYDLTFENITGEICDYGIIRALSVKNFYGLNINNYDSTTYNAPPIYIGKSATSPNSEGIVLINVARRGGTLAAGVYDISIDSTFNVVIIACTPTSPGNANFNVPTGNTTILATVLLNELQSNKFNTPSLVATLSGTTAQRPTLNLSPGMSYYDTTLGKPVWWTGAAWKDAAGATV